MCYGLPDADFKALQKMVDKKEEQQFLKFIRQFAHQSYGESDFKKPTRLLPQMTQEEFRAYAQKYKDINEMYDILRCQPMIEKVAKDALNQCLDPK